jgi:TetR/AcrR family transcriptional repressor of uid operon
LADRGMSTFRPGSSSQRDRLFMTDLVNRPSAEMRRQQVIDAAADCFRAHGFHSTSMAEVARKAGMSVGHIYRYFSGKEKIIEAIVAHDMERHMSFFRELQAESPTRAVELLVERMDEGFALAIDLQDAALNAEIAAEAARNPRITALIGEADAKALHMLSEVIGRAAPPNWTKEELAARAETLVLLFDGLSLRIIKHPDLNRESLRKAMRVALLALLAP